ncbi:MAG TPA: hypothetical protein VLI92_05075 [Candidatus Saccharimonadales bacterium]|nr:hypothetical protein [Candidatus Saccharimonadales bacterium]
MSAEDWEVGVLVGRGQNWLATQFLSIKPAKTESAKKVSGVQYNWNLFWKSLRLHHWFYALFALTCAVSLSIVVIKIPGFNYSIVRIVDIIPQAIFKYILHDNKTVTLSTTTIVMFVLLISWRKNVGSIYGIGPANLANNLPWFAMREELDFRAGSEQWNTKERLRACLSFGLMHFTMIIVPIGVALILSLTGFILMFVYLRSYSQNHSVKKALKDSATVHTLYNLLAITGFLVFVLYELISLIWLIFVH